MPRRNQFFEDLKAGLTEALDHAKGPRTLTAREVVLPDPPRPLSAKRIAQLRRRRLRVSQAVFARMLNASVHTVHSWEQGRSRPSGCTARFLQIVEEQPGILTRMLRKA
jgi:putative transcriptional regulator